MPAILSPMIVALAAALFGACMLSVCSSLLPAALANGRSRSTLAAATLVLAAPVGAALLFLALATPTPFAAACHCLAHAARHPHLCWTHPANAAGLVSPALAVLAVWCATRLLPAVRAGRDFTRSALLVRSLRALAPTLWDGVELRLADCGRPTAFTAGLFRPVVVVDRSLWSALDDEQRRAVAHHERAHALRYDGMTLAWLRLALAALPFIDGEKLLERWRLRAEAYCDQYAARLVGSLTVADTLLAVQRLQTEHGGASAATPSLSIGISGADLEARVRGVLAEPRSNHPAPVSDVLSLSIVAAGCALLTAVWPGDFVHHLVETAAGFLGH
ncbi:MAG TPA: M48 family metalloprotease [Polyangiaceae bacterium]